MRSIYFSVLFTIFIANDGLCQSFYFGTKAGLGLNVQKWNSFDQEPLISPLIDLFIESYAEDSPSSLFAQLGYHTRGSSLRFLNFSGGASSDKFKFNNLSLMAAAKRVLDMEKKFRPYYLVGVRVEYTMSTNLSDYEQFESLFYPVDFYVNKFNYGFSAGGGFEFDFGELYGGFIEFVVSPDLSRQYDSPAIQNVISPFTGAATTIPRREIRNLAIEISFGIRFLRKVEYY